jgi:hypothetical protein
MTRSSQRTTEMGTSGVRMFLLKSSMLGLDKVMLEAATRGLCMVHQKLWPGSEPVRGS